MSESDHTLPPESERTRASTGPVSPGQIPLPEKVGRYKPLRILGHGGMGVVYEAEQAEPRRRVALKVIRAEVASEEMRRRFAHESVFLARLQHPGIAQVYEAGTAETAEGPLPFIAMELIEGSPLGHWSLANDPDRRTRIEVMIQLCDAVQHAHQRGLIHRDLKPGNVLVDADGRPRVLDFGVARPHDTDLETSLVTTHGELVGTLAYMSPEQLTGDPDDIDTRSDVYALGVLLYELLADTSPLELGGRPLEEVLRAVREEDPPSLASRNPELAGDLTLITATAMSKDLAHRYASANGLAMDLQRFLNDEPISARPPSTVYQLRKFARRHRSLVVSTVIVAAALVLGVVGSTWQAVRATRAERLAESRLEQAETVTGFMQDMLASVQPEEAQGREVTVSEVLDRAAGDLDDGGLADQPAVEMALRRTLGLTYQSLGDFDTAGRHLARGRALADSLYDEDALERQQLVVDIATNEARLGHFARSESLIAPMLDRLPPGSDIQRRALTQMSDVHYDAGRWQAADSLLQIVQEIATRTADPDSIELADVLISRAFLAEQQRLLDQATSLNDRAERIYRAHYGDGHPRMIRVLTRKGEIATTAGVYQDALPPLEEALAIADIVFAPNHPSRADVLARLGTVYLGMNRFDDALRVNGNVVLIRREALGPDHRDIAVALTVLGQTEARLGDFEAAERHQREALAMRERLYGPVHVAVVDSWGNLGHLASFHGEPARAESLFVKASEILAQIPEETGDLQASFAHYTAMAVQGQGDHARAEAYFRQTIEFHRAQFGDEHALVARGMSNLATNLFRQGRKDEAADVQAEALAMQRALGVEGTNLILAIGNVAYILDDAGRYAEADTLHREYIALAEEVYGDQHPYPVDARLRYAANLIHRELWDEAEFQARQCMAWRIEHLPEDDYKRVTGNVVIAEILVAKGEPAEADRLLTPVEAYLAGENTVPARYLPRIGASVERVRGLVDAALAES